MITLGYALDGRLILGSNQPFPADIKHVEYYRDQRLFNLVFETQDEETALMPCELTEKTDNVVRYSPNIMVIALTGSKDGAEKPYGYTVPLIQIGV